jgi:hypothetical protein
MKKLSAVLAFILLLGACTQEQKPVYQPVSVDMRKQSELMVLLVPPQNGLKNFLIQDNESRRIMANIAEVKQKRLVILPPGDYDFSAEGVRTATFPIDDDCSVTIVSNRFAAELFSQITFYDGSNYYASRIVEGRSYWLTILNIENAQPSAYTAEISGKGNIPLASRLSGNKVVSAARITPFTAGTYTVTGAVNGDPSKIEPKEFTVVDNDTTGPALDKSGKHYYRSSGVTKPFTFVLTDPSGIDISKTWLEIDGVQYPSAQLTAETASKFRVSIQVPQPVFNERSGNITAKLHMTDNDSHRGDSDKSSRDESIVLEEATRVKKTFTFLWNGRPLEEIEVQSYAGARGIRAEMSKRDYNALDKSSFTNLGTESTGNRGEITYPNLYLDDTVTFVFTGPADRVYSQAFTITDDSPEETIAVAMPPKGKFETELLVEANAADKWVRLLENEGKSKDSSHFKAVFYYKIFKNDRGDRKADKIDNRQVEDKNNGFEPLPAEFVAATHIGDDRMLIEADLRDIPIQSYFRFLVTVEYYNEDTKFVMPNTADEITSKPITIRLE